MLLLLVSLAFATPEDAEEHPPLPSVDGPLLLPPVDLPARPDRWPELETLSRKRNRRAALTVISGTGLAAGSMMMVSALQATCDNLSRCPSGPPTFYLGGTLAAGALPVFLAGSIHWSRGNQAVRREVFAAEVSLAPTGNGVELAGRF
ncbi:MAG: hypothetical protein EP330_12860 [Deltaproteobacteria bacterium]|nr:MAG: hypothetical protein EP330_12860 [Deltaproteobacteria bacterium]